MLAGIAWCEPYTGRAQGVCRSSARSKDLAERLKADGSWCFPFSIAVSMKRQTSPLDRGRNPTDSAPRVSLSSKGPGNLTARAPTIAGSAGRCLGKRTSSSFARKVVTQQFELDRAEIQLRCRKRYMLVKKTLRYGNIGGISQRGSEPCARQPARLCSAAQIGRRPVVKLTIAVAGDLRLALR